jgi:SAM-dependent methyltransferase
VLDLGCGLGKNVGPFEARGFSVYGVDPAYAAVRRCRDIVAQPQRFIVGTATDLPWRDGSFNRVLDIGSLHCMRDAERRIAVLEIARVLSPGGLLYSRFFKPRGLAWVQRQPMQVDHFGLTLDEVSSLLDGPLVCESVTEEASVIYAKARKPLS